MLTLALLAKQADARPLSHLIVLTKDILMVASCEEATISA
jgi:hypothetical protein